MTEAPVPSAFQKHSQKFAPAWQQLLAGCGAEHNEDSPFVSWFSSWWHFPKHYIMNQAGNGFQSFLCPSRQGRVREAAVGAEMAESEGFGLTRKAQTTLLWLRRSR